MSSRPVVSRPVVSRGASGDAVPPVWTDAKQREFVREGLCVLPNAVPMKLVQAARGLIDAEMDDEKQALRGNPGREPELQALFHDSQLAPLFNAALGNVKPVRGCQVALRWPQKQSQFGGSTVDAPMSSPFGWGGHCDGMNACELQRKPQSRQLLFRRCSCGALLLTLHAAGVLTLRVARVLLTFCCACAAAVFWDEPIKGAGQVPIPNDHFNNFDCLVGVALNDQLRDDCGNLGLLPRSHKVNAEFFRHQRDAGGPLGPGGPDWPLVFGNGRALPPPAHSMEGAVKGEKDEDGASEWYPKPKQMKLRAGDAVLAHYLTGHGPMENLGDDTRYMIYFRVFNAKSGPIPHQGEGRAAMALCDEWLSWPGLQHIAAADAANVAAKL